jgi:hypothetical protein
MLKEHEFLMFELLKKELGQPSELKKAIKLVEAKFQIETTKPMRNYLTWGEIAYDMKQAGVKDTLAKIKFKLEKHDKNT